MSHVNRITPKSLNPSPQEIEKECEEIRSKWSGEVKKKRNVTRRLDAANSQFQANLRFMRFLVEMSEDSAGNS